MDRSQQIGPGDISGVRIGDDEQSVAFILSHLTSDEITVCSYWQVRPGTTLAVCYTLQSGSSYLQVLECGKNKKCKPSVGYTALCSDWPNSVDSVFGSTFDQEWQVDCDLAETGFVTVTPVSKLKYINTCSKKESSQPSASLDCVFKEQKGTFRKSDKT